MARPSSVSFRDALLVSGGADRDDVSDPICAANHLGLFSAEDEEREISEMPLEEVYVSQADLYGTYSDGANAAASSSASILAREERHCARKYDTEATASFRSLVMSEGGAATDEERDHLAALDKELGRISPEKKGAYLEALRQCPHEVNADRRMAFMHREEHDAAAAAKRLVRYWERKLEIFGPELCYVPLTLERAMGDVEIGLMSIGYMSILPKTDSAGRALIVVRNGLRNMEIHSPKNVLRVNWYILHCAMEDPDTRKRGFVLLLTSKNMNFGKFDPKLVASVLELEKVYLPFRLRAIHHCHPPQFLRAINPIMRFMMGRRFRHRTCVHGGSGQVLREKLERYGISPDHLPRDFGGPLDVNNEKWLTDRLELEQRMDQDAADKLDVLATAVLHAERRDTAIPQKFGGNEEFTKVGLDEDRAEQMAKKRKESPPCRYEGVNNLVSRSTPPLLGGMTSEFLEAPQASQVQTMDTEQNLPLREAVALTGSVSNPRDVSGFAGAPAGLTTNATYTSRAESREQALVNAVLQELQQKHRAQSTQGQTRKATVPELNVSPSIAATATDPSETARSSLVTPLAMTSGVTVGSALPISAHAQRVDDMATLQAKLLAYSKQPSLEARSIGGELHTQQQARSAEAFAVALGASASTGVALHPSLVSRSTGLSVTNPLQAVPNQLSPEVIAGFISQLTKSNLIAGQPMTAIRSVPLHQEIATMQSATLLQQQQQQQQQRQALLNSMSLTSNAMDATLLHLARTTLSAPAPPNATLPETAPLQLPRTLHVLSDEVKISSYQCLVRQQAEAFVATEEHVRNHARGRCKPIVLGQVGIRCRHCRGLPLKSSPRGSIYFPAELVGMYQTAQKMASLHLANATTPCPSMPLEVREKFRKLYASKSTVGGGKHYWAEAGKTIGLVDSPNGIRFKG